MRDRMKKTLSGSIIAAALGATLLVATPAHAAGDWQSWFSMSYSVKQRCVDAVGWKAFEYRNKGYETISFACVQTGGLWHGKVMYRTP